jgi:methylmalonyl-CoA/ethylmalonyl-CoA epimerase
VTQSQTNATAPMQGTILQGSTIDQIGMVVVDARQAAETLHRVFGLGPFRLIEWPIEGVDPEATYHGAPGSFRIRVAFAQVGAMQLELVEPVEGASIWSEFLQSHGPGLHHVRIAVPDFEQAASALEALGGPTVCSGRGFHVGSKWAYYDVSQILEGLVVEIRKSPDESSGEGAWAAEGRQIGCTAT